MMFRLSEKESVRLFLTGIRRSAGIFILLVFQVASPATPGEFEDTASVQPLRRDDTTRFDSTDEAVAATVSDTSSPVVRTETDSSPASSYPVAGNSDSTHDGAKTFPQTKPVTDTSTVEVGSYLSAGIGWSLGGFGLLDLWENALPESLGSFGLTDTSLRVTGNPSLPGSTDTALLGYSVKRRPATYTMSFPFTVSLLHMGELRRFNLSLTASWMHKNFASTIAAKQDSMERKLDYRERINIYSLFLTAAWGWRIPEEYFSVDGFERCWIVAALDLSPLIACTFTRDVTHSSDDIRLTGIHDMIESPRRRLLRGGEAGLRIGISMMKRLNPSDVGDFGIWYTMQYYGHFYEKGDRAEYTSVDPASGKGDRPLTWISNRFEITFALMRKRGR